MKRKTLVTSVLAAAAAGTILSGSQRQAAAQDIEVPVLVIESPETDTGEGTDDQLDLANLVQTAAKGVTTVQEAPAIITVIPGDELRDRQTRNLEETLDLVPGFLRYGAMHGQFPFAATRGTLQSMLFLRDSVSMFDPTFNAPSIGRGTPMETIKRVEIVSGPGGVLWGANSFLGVVNVITKDAEDVQGGLEASAGYGDGPGDALDYRGYVMIGKKLFHDKVKLMAHSSFDTYKGALWHDPGHMFSTPLPNPNSYYIYGSDITSDPARSYIFNFDGKASVGALNLYWSIPYMIRNYGETFPGSIVQEHMQEDNLMNGECSPLDRNDPNVLLPGHRCVDRGRAARLDQIDWYERYGIGEYKTRFADNKAGLTFKTYFIQFVRDFKPIAIQPASTLIPGGLAFEVNADTYRAGGSVDGDIELTSKLRVLYGAEAFHEWLPDNTRNSRQGAGAEAFFWGPYDNARLPLPCPHSAQWSGTGVTMVQSEQDCPLTFLFKTSRTTIGAFADGQLRPTSKLILDGGVRVQAAPAIIDSSSRTYGLVPLFSGAAVYEFLPDFHLKLNVAEGFRAPVFNNTDSNGQAVEINGSPDLKVETSRSYQGEINARVLRGKKRIRELDVRADYSYTTLHNFITFVGGRYDNVGDRGISSAEFLAKLYLKGDHRIEVGYTYVKIDEADKGSFLSMPENWFNVSGVLNLIPGRLEGMGIVKIIGGFEDPNRRVEARDLKPDPTTGNSAPGNPMQTVNVYPYELVIDRIPPSAELEIGLRAWFLKNRLTIAAQAFNALNAVRFQPDAFSDLVPRLEILPTHYEAFRFFVSATYSY